MATPTRSGVAGGLTESARLAAALVARRLLVHGATAVKHNAADPYALIAARKRPFARRAAAAGRPPPHASAWGLHRGASFVWRSGYVHTEKTPGAGADAVSRRRRSER